MSVGPAHGLLPRARVRVRGGAARVRRRRRRRRGCRRGYGGVRAGGARSPRAAPLPVGGAGPAHQGRGVVVLPTGAGKTWVACLAIEDKRRSTLVIAPTLDLVRQWYDVLRTTFGISVGVIGGGEYDVRSVTVSTYDSAHLHMEHLGNRFGLVVFDECHHLPGPAYALAARACVAPFRLGLTATPERADGRARRSGYAGRADRLPQDIVDLSATGGYLAPYDTVRLTVESAPMIATPTTRRAASTATSWRATASGCRARRAGPTSSSVRRAASGRRAMAAYRRQRGVAFAAPAKLDYVELLLDRHRDDRALLFTQDNATAYEISRRFLIPIITHETRVRERSEILAGLADGGYGAVVTSKVLNEGVDIPEAAVAIVVSGSASVREHVQRLGRVLRAREGKRALLYELVTGNDGNLHQRPPAGSQCLPLTWSRRGGAATSCA